VIKKERRKGRGKEGVGSMELQTPGSRKYPTSSLLRSSSEEGERRGRGGEGEHGSEGRLVAVPQSDPSYTVYRPIASFIAVQSRRIQRTDRGGKEKKEGGGREKLGGSRMHKHGIAITVKTPQAVCRPALFRHYVRSLNRTAASPMPG